jgi:hypothetical protein
MGVGRGVEVAVGSGVGVGVAVALGLAVGLAVGDGVAVGRGVRVSVGELVARLVAVGDGVPGALQPASHPMRLIKRMALRCFAYIPFLSITGARFTDSGLTIAAILLMMPVMLGTYVTAKLLARPDYPTVYAEIGLSQPPLRSPVHFKKWRLLAVETAPTYSAKPTLRQAQGRPFVGWQPAEAGFAFLLQRL